MGYKGLPFMIVWVEFPDITAALNAIDAKSYNHSDGSDIYTVPVPRDSNTGAPITGSLKISSSTSTRHILRLPRGFRSADFQVPWDEPSPEGPKKRDAGWELLEKGTQTITITKRVITVDTCTMHKCRLL
jgi:hypothetical protein